MRALAFAAAVALLGCGSIAPDAASQTEPPHDGDVVSETPSADAPAIDASDASDTEPLTLFISPDWLNPVDVNAVPVTPAFTELRALLGGERGTDVTADAVFTLDDPRLGSIQTHGGHVEFYSATSFPWLGAEGVGYAATTLRASADGATGSRPFGFAVLRGVGEQQDFLLDAPYIASDSFPLPAPPQILFASVHAPTSDVTFTLTNDPSNPKNPDGSFVDAKRLVSVRAIPDPASDVTIIECTKHVAIDTNGDGVLDTFPGAVTQKVCFAITAATNDIAPGYDDNVGEGFVVWIDVFGGVGAVKLDHRAIVVTAGTIRLKHG